MISFKWVMPRQVQGTRSSHIKMSLGWSGSVSWFALASLVVISNCSAERSGLEPVAGGSGGSSGLKDATASGGSGGTGARGGSSGAACNEPSCTGNEQLGEACNFDCQVDAASSDALGCWGRHCGITSYLVCVDGSWQIRQATQGGSTPWDFACAPDQQGAVEIASITRGQCCGEPVSNAVPSECRYCPADAPVDGAACNLPGTCNSDAGAPTVIDCFYTCCCYGSVTWAQCDGQRWHVTTDCSSK